MFTISHQHSAFIVKWSVGLRLLSFSELEAKNVAENMIGHKLYTKQTGPDGLRVSKAMIVERLYVRREYYFGLILDRESNVSLLFCMK